MPVLTAPAPLVSELIAGRVEPPVPELSVADFALSVIAGMGEAHVHAALAGGGFVTWFRVACGAGPLLVDMRLTEAAVAIGHAIAAEWERSARAACDCPDCRLRRALEPAAAAFEAALARHSKSAP